MIIHVDACSYGLFILTAVSFYILFKDMWTETVTGSNVVITSFLYTDSLMQEFLSNKHIGMELLSQEYVQFQL